MSNPNGTGEVLVRMDGVMAKIDTGYVAPCDHKGLIEFDPSAQSVMPYKCLTCGRTFCENPSASMEGGCNFEEAIEKTDKDVRARLDQAARNIDRIAGKHDCLKEADKIINGERRDSYGAPEDSFTIIAGYWNVFLAAKLKALGIDVKDLLSPLDTTNMMVLFKQARKLGQRPSRDNYVDSCGYEAIGADRLSE